MLTLFLDLDGVLADFACGVRKVTGKRPEDLSLWSMWRALARAPGFFETLAFMEDAEVLFPRGRVHVCRTSPLSS